MDDRSPLAELIGNLDERRCEVVEIPGRDDGKCVGLWILTQYEVDMARTATWKYLRQVLKLSDADIVYDPAIFDDNWAIERLAIALRDPETPQNQFAEDGRELRQRLSPQELA